MAFITIQTNHLVSDEQQALIVNELGKAEFMQAYHSDATQNALQNDFALRAKLGIRALPAYLFCYGDKQRLQIGVLNFADFVQNIDQLSDGKISLQLPYILEPLLWGL